MANNVEANNVDEFKEILHNLERRDLAILYNALQLDGEVAQRQYIRKQRPTKLDGTLYNAYCARVLVENPDDYVQEEIRKRIALTEDTYYTFFYCYIHDDGWIIRGRHACVPEGYQHEHAHNCDWGDWHNQGIIVTNRESGIMDIVEEVRLDYDRFGGGFVFALYQDTLTDETGKKLNMDDHPKLKEWINQRLTI
jgi:hypothetical protein